MIGAPEELESAFAAAVRDHADAATVFGDNLIGSHASLGLTIPPHVLAQATEVLQ
jgi:hypothetical protein